MIKFPVSAPKKRVIKALKSLGFQIVREREHIAMSRENADGTKTKRLKITFDFLIQRLKTIF
jgi:predicted RNA binding protein YcfA (HicA-like mRNA interferase family)